MSAYGIYQVKVVAPFTDGTCWVVIPQLFGDIQVPVTKFATPLVPLTTPMGWVVFEGGVEDRPVWVAATPDLAIPSGSDGLFTGTITAITGSDIYLVAPGLSTKVYGPVVSLVDVAALAVSDLVYVGIRQNTIGEVVLVGKVGGVAVGGGSSSFQYVHTQTVAMTTWTINHNLGGYPNVTTVDYSQIRIFGELTYVNNNQVTVTFTTVVDGKAFLS